jgi:glycosyltransferase involved in cell wall biosynthesis
MTTTPETTDKNAMLINASRVGNVGGLRQYTEAVLQCLSDIKGITVVRPAGIPLRTEHKQRIVPGWLASKGRVSKLRPLLWWIYCAFAFPAEAGRRILCTTHHVLPFRRRQIVTVHDLRPYFYPDNAVQHFYFTGMLARALKRCDGILTVSESSRDLIAQTYGIDKERIHVVPNVVDCTRFHPAPKRSNGTFPFLLAIGSTWKHKNISELLRMHSFWQGRYQLKIVAGAGQYQGTLRALATELGIEHHVEFLTDLNDAEIQHLYQQCAALVYPSLMEGFGLPPLEAMACGRPVIVSDIPTFRETCGNIPLFIRLGDRESWKEAFECH